MWPVDSAVCFLLREAKFLANEADDLNLDAAKREERRAQHQLYLEKSAQLLEGYRLIVSRLWEDAASTSGSVANLVDMFLPGNIHIHNVAGCATYNRATQYFRGCFSGNVEIPSTQSFFVVENASFDSRFNFALTAHGDIRIPKDAGKQVRLRVPEHQPVVLEWNESSGLEISGRAKLDLPGGYFVGGYWNVDPPAYAFGLEAGGLKVDLLDSVGVTYPTINRQKLELLDTAAQDRNRELSHGHGQRVVEDGGGCGIGGDRGRAGRGQPGLRIAAGIRGTAAGSTLHRI